MANEVRLIDANALERNVWLDGACLVIAVSEVDNAPTVDAVVLPCKLGDSLFCVYSPPHPADPAHKGKWFISDFEVARFHFGVKGLSIEMYCFGTVSAKEIGKTVFLTQEEAEAALAKLNGERKDNENP